MADFIISECLAIFSKFSSVGLYHLCNWGQNMLNIKKKNNENNRHESAVKPQTFGTALST